MASTSIGYQLHEVLIIERIHLPLTLNIGRIFFGANCHIERSNQDPNNPHGALLPIVCMLIQQSEHQVGELELVWYSMVIMHTASACIPYVGSVCRPFLRSCCSLSTSW